MRAILLCGLLLTSTVAAQEPEEGVPSYSFQGPKRHSQHHQASIRRPAQPSYSSQPTYSSAQPVYQPQPSLSFIGTRTGQRAVPPSLSNWGGTVVQADTPGSATITSNGSIPPGSMVGIGRGSNFLGQARVTTADSGSAQLATNGNLQLQPGDWVNVVSIPGPPPQQMAYAGSRSFSSVRLHPTSTNADPTYQRWLRQGFTLGGFHRGRIGSYGGFRRGYR